MSGYDIAIVGSGIVGLAHAVAGLRIGKRVVVIERDARPVGASIRNFGFITITGQRRGDTWRRAHRSAQVWAEVAQAADIAVEHRGLIVVGRRQECSAVLEAFAATEMGEGCSLLSPAEAAARWPEIAPGQATAMLYSPHELRVESRLAIPRLVRHLADAGVTFLNGAAVHAVAPPRVETSRGPIEAETIIVCPGDDLVSLYPERIAARGVTRCKLQMMRTASPGFRLPAALMTDLSLVRYRGYADLPESAPLRRRLEAEQPEHLRQGVHLIAVQSADDTLVVGDSHVYEPTPDPFASTAIDALALEELEAVVGRPAPPVVECWTGTYSSGADDMFMDAPEDAVRLVMVTSGTGASTAFAIAEETMADLFGSAS